MNSNNPGPISSPISNSISSPPSSPAHSNHFPVTAPLSDKGRQGDVDLGTQLDFASTEENIDSSAVIVDPPVSELAVAYNRTFLQISPSSMPKKEMLAQLEPFAKTVTTDLSENLILSEYAIEEANVQTSTDILNIIEKAMEAGQNTRNHYGPTGINAEVTEETSPMGLQGVSEQDALLHSLDNITLTALIAPAKENFNSRNTQVSHQFLSAEEGNSFKNASALNQMTGKDETALVKSQDTISNSLYHSLNKSLETLKGIVNNPSWTVAVAA